MFIKYKDIPDEIKKNFEVKTIARKSRSWTDRKLFAEYMNAYNQGVKEYDPKSNLEQKYKNNQLCDICIFYILKKELLSRMSPLLNVRSKEFITVDNKELILKFDGCLKKGISNCFDESQLYMNEILNRIENN